MKNKYYIATLSATVLTCAMSYAGDTLATAPTAAGITPYLGVSGVYNEFTLSALGSDSITEDASGFKLVGGFDLSHGFSVDGSFEKTYGSIALGGLPGQGGIAGDFNFTDTRLIVNYTHELEQGFSLVGGLGYGYFGVDFQGLIASSEGLMAEAGIKYQSGQFFGGLTYSHLFSMHSSSLASLLAPGLVQGEDVGAIEVYVGYQINENVAATLSAETQVFGDSLLEKDLGIALGLQYSF